MSGRLGRWVRGRQGACCVLLSLAWVVMGVRAGTIPVLQAPFAVAILLPVLAPVVWMAALVWEGRTLPATPRFAKAPAASSSRQLREDGNARVFRDRGGFLFSDRFFFVGTGCAPVRLPAMEVARLREQCQSAPVLVAQTPARRYWCYRDQFVWENQGLQARDVMALLHERSRRHERELARAHTLLEVEQGRAGPVPRQRQPIPREVKHAVFRRDGGRCVECRSDFDLQYDHVIPWSLGGADTEANLQLLCSACNQRKGATL